MKSLKRTLSLVLVLVMVLGLVGISAGASFKDEAKINYKEAVGVMTGIGALVGYPDGTFNGTGTVTREEAVKTVVYSVLGADIAKTLAGTATGFADVDAGRWSSGVIAYAVSRGIINGRDAKTFDPTGNVTANEVGKMMLCAAGYGKKGEFIGSSWELNTAILANQTGIFAGSKAANYSTPATREETALYAFNGITKVTQVNYEKANDLYKPAENTIAKDVYKTLVTSPMVIDGMAGYIWTYKGQPITGFVGDATVLKTSTDGTALADLTTNTSSKYIGYMPSTIDVDKTTTNDQCVEYFLNGATQGYDATGANAVKASVAKRGAIVSFIDKNGDSKYDVVSVTLDKVVTLTGDAKTTTTGAVTTVTVPGLGISNVDVKGVIGYEGLKKGDVVLYHTDGTNHFISKCTPFTGTLNALNSTAKIAMIDGKQYTLSEITSAFDLIGNKADFFGVAGATYYTDKGGNIAHAVAPEATVAKLDNTLFVTAAGKENGFSVQAKVLMADGTSSVITVAKVGDVAAATGSPALNTFYTFAKNDNGTYNLKLAANQQKVTDYDASDVIFKKGTADFFLKKDGTAHGKLGTASTVFVIETATAGTYKTYTGINNAPQVVAKDNKSVGSVLFDAKNYALFAVAYGATTDNTTSTLDYVFATTPATEMAAKPNYFTYLGSVLNGEVKPTVDAVDDTTIIPGMLQAITSYENGKVKTATTATANTLLIAPVYDLTGIKFNGTTGSYDGGSFITTDTCKYFMYDVTDPKAPKLTATTAAEIAALEGSHYAIQGVEASANDSRIAQLFVTVYPVGVNANGIEVKATVTGCTKGLTMTDTAITGTAAAPTAVTASDFAAGSKETFRFATTANTYAAATGKVQNLTTPAVYNLNTDITVAKAGDQTFAIGFYAYPFVNYQVLCATVSVAATV